MKKKKKRSMRIGNLYILGKELFRKSWEKKPLTEKIISRTEVKAHSLKLWLVSDMEWETPTEFPFSRNSFKFMDNKGIRSTQD